MYPTKKIQIVNFLKERKKRGVVVKRKNRYIKEKDERQGVMETLGT